MAGRRERIGIPLGIGGLAVLAVVATALVGGGSDGGPARLPVRFAAGGGAAGAEDAAALATRDVASSYAGVTYEIVGELPADLPGKARAHRLAAAKADVAAVRELAAAFGMSTEPTRVEGAWVVRSGDREVRVDDAPGNPWYYSPFAKSAVGCGAPAPDGVVACPVPAPAEQPVDVPADGKTRCEHPTPPDGAEPALGGCGTGQPAAGTAPYPGSGDVPVASDPHVAKTCTSPPPGAEPTKCDDAYVCPEPAPGTATDTVRCAPVPQPSPPVLPAEDAVRAKVAPLLDALGLGGEPLTLTREWDTWNATVRPRVGGLDTVGWATHVAVDADLAFRYASGRLGEPTPGDTYPLLAPKAAIDQYAKSMPVARIGIACDSADGSCPEPEPTVMKVTGVRLGLTLLYGGEDEAWLVPAWLLAVQGAEAHPVPVVALAEEHFAPPAPATDLPARDGGGEVPPDAGSGSGSGGGVSGSTGTVAEPTAK